MTNKHQGWQPIATAPRDGTQFLIDCEQAECFVTIATFENGELVSAFDGRPYLPFVTPARYWHTLPPPPEQEGGL